MTLILRFRAEEELPVYLLGLSDEDFPERAIAESKLRRVVRRNMKLHPHITEVSVRVKRQKTRGERARYEATARVMSAEEQVLAEAEGWDLLQVFDELCETLDKALRKSKHEPRRIRSRRRSRFHR
ncbi:MAG: HPF/RaiA family ribosome-associated protein [Candidatus Bathyarchaeia archaeon]